MLLAHKRLKRRPLGLLSLEALIVFLSVFLALGLDSWRETRTNRGLAALALAHFAQEVEDNARRVQRAADAHGAVLRELRAEERRGVNIQAATIQNNAWETAQHMGVMSHLEFGVVNSASRIHELQNQYQSAVELATRIVYEGNFYAPDDISDERLRSGLSLLVSHLLEAERELLEEYARFSALIRG